MGHSKLFTGKFLTYKTYNGATSTRYGMSTFCRELAREVLKAEKSRKWVKSERVEISEKNTIQKILHIMTSNCPQKLVSDLKRRDLKMFVLNGNWGNSTYRVPKTLLPWLYTVYCIFF